LADGIKAGDNIAVNYTGKLKDGTVFDTSIGREPLGFTAGAGQMIKGFDKAVIGMKVGETKTVEISPEEAYGTLDQNKIFTFDKSKFGNFDEMQVGMVVSSGVYQGKIIKKTSTEAVIDFNHELAGKTLIFEISIVSIN
jgi:peptidylprolyl isomerase